MLCFTSLWAGGAVLLDRYGARRSIDEKRRYEAIVVAGCRVMPDGSLSTSLARRTERAVELWKQGLAPLIVFTGGAGDTLPSEARAAANHAFSLGVPREAQILEQWSTSTEENARFARALLDGGDILVVSDSFHVFRCERVFKRYFQSAQGVGSISKPGPRLRGALREVGALTFYALTGKL